MKKDDLIYVHHMIDAADFILSVTSKIGKDGFIEDRVIRDAVIRNFEVIGEAAKNVSFSFRNKHGEIDWKKIAGLRDILIHEYFGVDYEKVWNVIIYRLPELKEQLKKLQK